MSSSTSSIDIPLDPSSQSQQGFLVTNHTTVNFSIDFEHEMLIGNVKHKLNPVENPKKLDYLLLDVNNLNVDYVMVNGEEATWEFKPHNEPLGSAMKIGLGKDTFNPDEEIVVDIGVRTRKECTALQFMRPEQTSTKNFPFVFSQCQPTHARSIFPCQDTPAIKATYEINITSPFPVVSSGVPVSTRKVRNGTLYRFMQSCPIPSYLFALSSGELTSAPVGVISKVYSSPDIIDACTNEFKGEVDKFMTELVSILSPYTWGQYNILVLPPSFPYGGMENPVFTFATPSILSGDKQNLDVIAHEMSHSWSGNLVTNASWGHFWLNEGWTTYLERRVLGEMHGEPYRHFLALIGWQQLLETVQHIGSDHKYTKLVVDLDKTDDADEALTTVAYEKGFAFLFHLESVVGKRNFTKFTSDYFAHFHAKSLTSGDFMNYMFSYFKHDMVLNHALHEVQWFEWFHTPGLPEFPDYDTSLASRVYKLVEKWANRRADFIPQANDVEGFFGNQFVVFLDRVVLLDQQHSFLTGEIVRLMGHIYGLRKSKNLEIRTRFFAMSLRAGDREVIAPTQKLLSKTGRMKFVRKLYKALASIDYKAAQQTYKDNESFYHPICKNMIEKELSHELRLHQMK